MSRVVSCCLAIVAALLLTVGGVFTVRDYARTQPQPLIAAVEADRSESTSTPQYLSKRIADIQPIADRVLADNPETEGQAPSDFGEFNVADWRLLKLLIPKPDGEWLKVTLARPLTWIEESERDEHGRLWLEFEELGIANWADVLAIEPCPAAAVGEGRLVTGKFEHSSAEVIDLYVDGLTEPIGTTSNHPFWSEDQQEFVQAGSLSVGEHLRLENGNMTTVTAINQISGTVPVFNLEVDGEHVYYVSKVGILVHNAGSKYGLSNASNGLKNVFSGGSVRGRSMINIRATLTQNGFTQSLTQNGKGYLYQNSLGEQVRMMRRGTGWDLRIRNRYGNYLDEFGNVGLPAATHNINVFPF